ncbi:MAG: DUF2304 domain-containing protein [Propionibacteriaceae bacterium]|nr:DUF2304 domain-containing protein [Propionibacteriaceae bacterium]
MSGYWFAVTLCTIFLVWIVVLLRRRRLKEKYAALWIVLALGVCIISAFPKLTVWLAGIAGVQLPVNLLFAVATFFLLICCVQLSANVSRLEEDLRTLAEELALIRARSLSGRREGGAADPEKEQPQQQSKTD